MSKKLTVKRMISFNGPNGDYIDFDLISDEQKSMFKKAVGEQISRVASNFKFERNVIKND